MLQLPGRAFRRWVFRCDTQIALARGVPAEAAEVQWPSGLIGRALTVKDLAQLHPDLARRRAAFRDYFQSGLDCFAAFDGEQAIAVCWIARHERQDPARLQFHFPKDAAYFFSLEVAAPYRNNGIAAQLQWLAWDTYRLAGFKQLILLVSLDNIPALKLYIRLGFRPCGRGRHMFHILHWRVPREFRHRDGQFDAILPLPAENALEKPVGRA